MKLCTLYLSIILTACLSGPSAFTLMASESSNLHIKRSDVHLHLVNFLQNGEYWSEKTQSFVHSSPQFTPAAGERDQRLVGLLKRMDNASVELAMVSGMPFVKKWSKDTHYRSTYYLDSSSRVFYARDTDYTVALAFTDYLSPSDPNLLKERLQNRQRLFPFISGFNSTDIGAVDMVVKRVKEFPGLWEGIGEVMSRHDDLTNLITGERSYADHPSIHRLSDFAGTFHLPVSIHHNIAPISPGNQKKKPVYLPEILRLFDAHPKTQFIWCHAGISRRIFVKNLPGLLDTILSTKKRYKHVYIDLSWVIYENYIYDLSQGIDNRHQWAELISKFPTNFMIGSDAVANFGNYKKEMNKFNSLFEVLYVYPSGEQLVKKVAHENFKNLMLKLREKRGGSGVILPKDYLYPENKFIPNPNPFYR